MDKYLGKKLEGRYEILELTGVGGMANVYRAHDVIEDRIVAVKILRDEYLHNEEFLRRFRNESKAIAVLSHPNIVKVYDVCFSERMQSIVMEFVDGITLKEYIDQQGRLRWRDAVHFVEQILRALQHAHDRGIVHRDIKPQNIMLLSDGTIKVTDFGIARFSRSETRTLTDKAIGSVHYISPEQASGGVTDRKSDIYSVGVMLYEMLTGALPFEADSPVSVALKQIQSQPKSPRQINPLIPEGLEEITMRAMQKNPANRYASAAEMLADIEEFKQNPSINFEYKYLSVEEEQMEQKRVDNAIQSARKKQQPVRRRKGTPYVSVLTGITAAFVLVTLGFVGIMLYLYNPFVTVGEIKAPNLLGVRYDSVSRSPLYDNVEVVYESEVYSDEYAKGVICEQRPAAGKTIKEGATIRVKVSSGPEMVTLPNFTNVEETVCYAQLGDAGLTYTTLQEYSDTVPQNYVIRTDPANDTQVPAGSSVTVVVSMGPEHKIIPVPELKGRTLEEAQMMLIGMKLAVGDISYDDGSSEPSGTIIAQDPAPPSEIAEGTEINLVVSGSQGGSNVDDDHGGSYQMVANCNLPDYDGMVTLESVLDGVTLEYVTINPAELRNWKQELSGRGTSVYEVYLNGWLYRRYEVTFESNTIKMVVNNESTIQLG